jgi:NAD+ diphosphatase
MLGYHAKATKTQISLNDQELEDAQWLSREEIITRLNQGLFVPPPKISISFRLIEDWFNQSATIPLKKLLHQSGAADF